MKALVVIELDNLFRYSSIKNTTQEPDEDNNRDGGSDGPGSDRFMMGPDGNMMMIPDGAPTGGYFGPDGTYYGPDGKAYGKGTPVVMGPNGDYYKVPDGAPPGGRIDENGNYVGPDGRNYGPSKSLGGPGSAVSIKLNSFNYAFPNSQTFNSGIASVAIH